VAWRARVARHAISYILGDDRDSVLSTIQSLDEETQRKLAELQQPHPDRGNIELWASEAITNAEVYSRWVDLALGTTAQRELVISVRDSPTDTHASGATETARSWANLHRPEKTGDPLADEGGWGTGIMGMLALNQGSYGYNDGDKYYNVVWAQFRPVASEREYYAA